MLIFISFDLFVLVIGQELINDWEKVAGGSWLATCAGARSQQGRLIVNTSSCVGPCLHMDF